MYVCLLCQFLKEYSFFRMSVSPYDKIQHESSTKYFPIICMENESFKSNCSIKNFYTDSNYLAIVISKSTGNTHKMWLVFVLLDIVVASQNPLPLLLVTRLMFISLAILPQGIPELWRRWLYPYL